MLNTLKQQQHLGICIMSLQLQLDKYKFKAISVEGSVCAIYSILKPWGYEMVSNPFSEVAYEGYFVHKDFINITYNA